MRKMVILFLMGMLCAVLTGCVSQRPGPPGARAPAQATTPSPNPSPIATPKSTPAASPDAQAADNEPCQFFYLPPEGTPREAEIHIYKEQRTLELVMDGEVAGRFPIGLGFSPEGDKEREGDGRTPVGEYYVCSRNDRSSFYLSLGVSYPNTADAQMALDNGLIDQETYERIADAEERRALPDWHTPLGGEICIHGGGSHSDWTWGCVATGNETMDILWEYCPHGTSIFIYE